MSRPHLHPRSRARLGTFVAGLALALTCFGMSPAHAAGGGRPVQAAGLTTVRVHAPAPAPAQAAVHVVRPGPHQVSEGGCGFLQRCVYFNRTEQTYLIIGSKWIVQAALCAGTLGIGCALAGLLVEIAAQWLVSRGGICPTSRPKLRVQYFPNPQVEGCVA